MAIKLINNLVSENNHLTRIQELFSLSDKVILASPYLMGNFNYFFGETDLKNLESFHLITTLIPNSSEQIKKTNSLVSLITLPDFKDNSIGCQISLNNKLHGKIYIFKKNDNYLSAIISSANFTNKGLSQNHEWGVEISTSDDIKELEKTLLESIGVERLTFEEIYRMKEVVDAFLQDEPNNEENDIDLDLTTLLNPLNWVSQLDDTVNFWLKPIGVTGDIIQEGHSFSAIDVGLGDLNFSKRRPSAVKPGDLLIAYGVGTTKIFSIYRVISSPQYVTDDEMEEEDWYERWPWYVTGENLTPNFGSSWWTHNLYIGALREEFLDQNEEGAITAVGGKTLGSLNFGTDKLRLSNDFGMFIINKVLSIESRA